MKCKSLGYEKEKWKRWLKIFIHRLLILQLMATCPSICVVDISSGKTKRKENELKINCKVSMEKWLVKNLKHGI
jgi:hypothetical protein